MERRYRIDLTLRGSEEDVKYVLKEIHELKERRQVKFMYIREL